MLTKRARQIKYSVVLFEWWENYKHGLMDTTQYKKEQEMRIHILPAFGNLAVKSISKQILQDFIAEKVNNNLSPNTIKCFFKIINSSLNWAVENQYIDKNPCHGIKLPRIYQKEIKVFTNDEIEQLIKAARPKWFGDMILLAYRTGMRRGEIYGLKWDDVDFKNAFLMIRRTVEAYKPGLKLIHIPKTKKSIRRIMLDDKSIEMLIVRKNSAKEGSEYVFENKYGKPISPWYNTKYMSMTCKAAQIPHRCFHTLRHTHATLLLSRNINPKIVQERLGHSKISTTMDTYSHVLPDMQQIAVDVLNQIAN